MSRLNRYRGGRIEAFELLGRTRRQQPSAVIDAGERDAQSSGFGDIDEPPSTEEKRDEFRNAPAA